MKERLAEWWIVTTELALKSTMSRSVLWRELLLPLLQRVPIEAFETGLAAARPYAAAVRWTVILLLVWRWPAVVRVLARRRGLSAIQVQALGARRWQLFALLAAVEILVAEQGLHRLLDVLA